MTSNIIEANAQKLVVRTNDGQVAHITVNDIAAYYAKDAKLGRIGTRTFAGITSDWKSIDDLAHLCFEYFARYDIDGLRDASSRYGLKPKF